MASAVPAAITSDGYSQHVWHAEDGLPEETVQALAQTPDRFLWIGTSGGLLRFDGWQFAVFDRDNAPAFEDNSVFCLYTSRDGTLWIGTEGGGLISYLSGKFRAWSKADGLTNGYVRAVQEDHDGNIWIGTDDGLFRLRDGSIVRVDGRNGIPASSIHAIYEDRARRLWFGGFHFFVKDQDTISEFSLPGGLSDNIKSIAQTSDGTLWVGTVGGLSKGLSRAGVLRFSRVAGVHSTVRTLFGDDDGSLLIGTVGEGLLKYKDGRLSSLAAGPVLPSNTVLATFIGSEKSIWIGTQTGLVRLNRTAVTTLFLPDFGNADFGTIYRDRDNSLWVCSSHLFHLTGGHVAVPHFPAPLGGARVRTVFRDSHGRLWFGTEGQGVFCLRHGVVARVPGTQPYIRAFAEDRAGGIWIGTDGGYCRWTAQGTAYFETHESVRALFVDSGGNVWVGKDRGLTLLRQPEFKPEVPVGRLANEKVWAIHQDPTTVMWFGTRSSGLFRWQAGSLTPFTIAQGLASNSVYQILEDGHGTLWLSGPNGISSISRRDLDRTSRDPSLRPAVKLYGTSDGLETTQMYGGVQPAGSVTSGGEVWFPSTAGPVRIGLDSDSSTSAPPAVIYHVLTDGREVPTNGDISIPPGEGKLEIQYSAIQLRSQDRVRFRYQLQGLEHNWTETRTRKVVYTNLPPGRYQFRLQAFDMDQPQTVSEAGLSLTWRPHLYETRLFYVLGITLLCALAWGVHRLRLQQVRARFQAVIDERNRLAREMHDTLIQGCTSTSALLEAIASMRHGHSGNESELLDHARLHVRAMADESRRAVWNLRQRSTDSPDLRQLLQQMTEQASQGSGIPVRFESSGTAPSLDPLTEHDLVMVAREAVHNSIRHARPREVDVQVFFNATSVRMRVTDDGCGFKPEAAMARNPEHFGLVGMRERTERLGGDFELHSEPNKGTEISIHLPVPKPAPTTGVSRARWPAWWRQYQAKGKVRL